MAARRYSAAREVARISEAAIERETAEKWAARSIACYRLHAAGGGVAWLLRAENYRHEALEHAALAGGAGRLVGVLERRIAKVRPKR